MGWFDRIFGKKAPENSQVNPAPSTPNTPPERLGLNGEYDDSGLAKRVALAFDQDSALTDEDKLWVAQTGSTVVLKGTVSDQATLDKMISVAHGVKGASVVDSSQVTVA
jgi:osmotically-inducible protein OsmY